MNLKNCLSDLQEILDLVQGKIDKAVSNHRYDESAMFRDIKKEVKLKINNIKSKNYEKL